MKPHEHADLALLHELREECAIIIGRIERKTLPDFVSDPSLQDGIALRLILIGESVKKLSARTKGQFPELEWSQMARFRDLAVHHYSRVDALQVWEIVQEEIPKLLATITPRKHQHENRHHSRSGPKPGDVGTRPAGEGHAPAVRRRT